MSICYAYVFLWLIEWEAAVCKSTAFADSYLLCHSYRCLLCSGTLAGSCMTHCILWGLLNCLCCMFTGGILSLIPGSTVACYACGYRRALRVKYSIQTTFIAPEGNGPLALNLSSMGKGQAWVNGQSIGRYWPAYLSPSTGCTENCDYRGPYDSNKCLKNCGEPAQTLYHVPRSWVHPGKNLLVLHEELGGDPSKITLSTRIGQELCVRISELDPPLHSIKPDSAFESPSPGVQLSCERGWRISLVSFASFGTPEGHCGNFSHGSCSADVRTVVQEACVGRESCSVTVATDKLGDPCPGIVKSLAVEAFCSE